MKMQIEYAEQGKIKIEELIRKCGFNSQRELLNNTLTLFYWVVKEIESGGKIASINDNNDKMKMLEMFCFKNLQK